MVEGEVEGRLLLEGNYQAAKVTERGREQGGAAVDAEPDWCVCGYITTGYWVPWSLQMYTW